eukprot:TRINITY_DN63733_c0_g1_i1.p1 TRINITY_DN63733_c0_g1~~TRINITY_DN63733_c0_g1_i1.p1  ORF type:complete len:824 (+),score=95.47 TRINITY_DN63733_c0_g1_i1:42-2474(+)
MEHHIPSSSPWNTTIQGAICESLQCPLELVGGDLFLGTWTVLLSLYSCIGLSGVCMFAVRRRFLQNHELFWQFWMETKDIREILTDHSGISEQEREEHVRRLQTLFNVDSEDGNSDGRLQGPALSVAGLSFKTTSPDGSPVQLLSDISCVIEYGKLTAIMGPSGAGKSTFLHVIGGRRMDGSYQGQVLLDSDDIEEEGVVFGVRYMRQFPVVGHPEQTALASLLNYGHRNGVGGLLTTGSHSGRDTLYRRAATLVQIFKMEHFIGRKIRMLSGGQLKLLRVAQVLVLSPRVILFDEPTSGLDALTAEILIKGLKEIAELLGFCIALVIHQPAESLFAHFHNIICLRKGGIAFDGPFDEVRQYVRKSIIGTLQKPWGARTFPDWILDIAQNYPELKSIHDVEESEMARREQSQRDNVKRDHKTVQAPFAWSSVLASEVGLFAFRSYNPIEAFIVVSGCLAFSLLVFLPLNLHDAWQPKHDLFRVTITGFVVGLQATRVTPICYNELSLQMNDLRDGILSPIACFVALFHFATFFCTCMGCFNTLFLNFLLPLVSGIKDPFGTDRTTATGWNGSSLESLGATDLASALVYNIMLSNAFGLFGLFILFAFGDFANNLPVSKSPTTMFYLTAVLATCSLFGGTVYCEKESFDHMQYFLYISPTYWYIKGTFIIWLQGRTYIKTPLVECGTVSGFATASLPRDFCGDELFETLYSSKNVNQGMPLLVLLCIVIALSIMSAVVFLYRMRHRHSLRACERECVLEDMSTEEDPLTLARKAAAEAAGRVQKSFSSAIRPNSGKRIAPASSEGMASSEA